MDGGGLARPHLKPKKSSEARPITLKGQLLNIPVDEAKRTESGRRLAAKQLAEEPTDHKRWQASGISQARATRLLASTESA